MRDLTPVAYPVGERGANVGSANIGAWEGVHRDALVFDHCGKQILDWIQPDAS